MSNLPFIVGIDSSKSRSGLCFGRPGEVPRFSSLSCSDLDDDAAAFKAMKWVRDFTLIQTIDEAFIEMQMKGFGDDIGRLQRNIPTMLTIKAVRTGFGVGLKGRSVPIHEVHASTARKTFLGNGRLGKDVAKQCAMAMCQDLGWEPSNLDEADAAAIWYHGCVQSAPEAAHRISDLVQKRIVGRALGGVPA